MTMNHSMSVTAIPLLSVKTLGHFVVWCGDARLEEKAWGREKARQLFQYLLTFRRRFVLKERIVDDLWPELDPGRAERDFKVALNALNDALQPNRPGRSLSVYMARQATSYGLNPEAPLSVDVDIFEQGLTAGSRLELSRPGQAITHYRQALDLYQGDYLPDALYDDWASSERERLTTLYLSGATRLATLLLTENSFLEAILWCQRVLAIDPCWEEAYRLLMRGHWHTGNRPQALRVYEQCRATLQQELAIEPMSETRRLYDQMTSN